jgi:flavodoxin
MKNLAVLSLVVLAAIGIFFSCLSAQESPATNPALRPARKILIVYLSRTNNTKTIAEMIQKKVGGKLVALELAKPYPADYMATVRQVVRENETGFLPPLKTKIDKIEQYDTVFVGFPTWGMQLPPPMKSFLSRYNLKGKTVVPFNTNDGYGVGSCFDTVKTLCRDSTVLEGFTTTGGTGRDGNPRIMGARANEAERAVEGWLRRIKVLH